MATFRALFYRSEREENLCVNGADAVPGGRQTPSVLGTMRRKVFSYVVKRGERSPSSGGMLQYNETKYLQVYEKMMKIGSHSSTTKEDRDLTLIL